MKKIVLIGNANQIALRRVEALREEGFVVLYADGGCSGAAGVDIIPAAHASARWARTVVGVIDCPTDPNTIEKWAGWIAASPGALRNWCRTAGLGSKPSLNLARMLRAVIKHQSGAHHVSDLLDVVDLRTMRRMLSLGDETCAHHAEMPRTVDDLLQRQRWIVCPNALRELTAALPATIVQARLAGYSLKGVS